MMREKLPILLMLTACEPDFDLRRSRVDEGRVLAVVAEPPEARPGEPVSYMIVAAGPYGPIDDPGFDAAYCVIPKSLAENNSVATECMTDPGIAIEIAGGVARSPIPSDACRLFGPDPPPGDFRPRDPDATGGYYQPLRITAFGQDVIHLERVLCNPADVAADVAREFSANYRPNRNPAPVRLEVLEHGRLLEAAADGIELSVGAEVELRVDWSEARESYAFVDRSAQAVIERREGLRVDWFATADGLAADRSGVEEGSDATSASNEFRAPSEPGVVHVWAVFHDSRGGSAVVQQRFTFR